MILRKYGATTTITFPLVDRGAVDFESTPVTFAAGDAKIMKDEGAFANTTNTPVHEGNGIYSIALTATELQAARITIIIIDSATKAWEDQAVMLETYGNASAQHALDLDNSTVDADVREWLGAAVNAATSGDPPADVERVRGTVLNILVAGRFPVNVERWVANTPNALNSSGDVVVDVRRVKDLLLNNPISGRVDSHVAAAGLATDAAQEIADEIFRMTTATIEAAGGGTPDDRTLYGVIAALMHKHERDAADNNIVLYESDDTTVLVTIPITKGSALDPIKSLDPP